MLTIERLTKRLGSQPVLNDVSLTIRRGEIFTLLGASGSGKTTLLRILAGLDIPDEGTIRLDGQIWSDAKQGRHLPPQHRRVGLVFQSYAIWPHLSVFDNVAYPLRHRRRAHGTSDAGRTKPLNRAQITEKVMRMLEIVGLPDFASRSATDLSGGQQQRVAMARALVGEPDLVLLDEPFSNLDVGLRRQLRQELRDLQERLGLTVVLVTHDQDDAFALSDRIGVLEHGTMSQIGRPDEIYDVPASAFIHEFVGRASRIQGQLARHHASADIGMAGTVPIQFSAAANTMSELMHPSAAELPSPPASALTAGARLDIWIKPTDIYIAPLASDGVSPEGITVADRSAGQHRLLGRVRRNGFRGDHHEVDIELADGQALTVAVPREARLPQPGEALALQFLKAARASLARTPEPL